MSPGIVDHSTLRERLRHVYWIGGGSCAGKSTIARQIADAHGMHVYSTDDLMVDHARRVAREESPMLQVFMAMDMDERWVTRSPKAMLETFHWFRGEAFGLIVEDLLQFPSDRRMIVEGFRLLPQLVQPLLSSVDHGVWLLPTPEFRESVVERRGGPAAGFLAKTSDPKRALANLLERDRMFTEILREETTSLELPTIDVDSTMSEDHLVARITSTFRLAS
jgi:2-phosphoglycerate kinase